VSEKERDPDWCHSHGKTRQQEEAEEAARKKEAEKK
jgi:hypothetical protein